VSAPRRATGGDDHVQVAWTAPARAAISSSVL
jgi:hypothetical protein